MLALIERVPLKSKLVMIMIIPLVGMMVFATSQALDRRAEVEEAGELELLVTLSVKTGNLLHETQKERGATAVFLASGGEKFHAELPAQQATTDAPRAEFLAFVAAHEAELPPEVVDGLAPALTALDQLDQHRRDTLALTAETSPTIGYFTDMNGRFLEAIAAVASASGDADLRGDSVAYLAFLNAKERAGIERAQLSAVFGTDQFAPGQYALVVSLVAAQESFLGLFEDIAHPEVLEAFAQRQADPIVAETARLEQIAIENGDRGFGVDSAVWFDTITARINLLKEVEDFQAERILAQSADIVAQGRAELARSLLLTFGLLAFTLFLGTATIIGLARRLREIASAATRIASGELKVDPVMVSTNDDVGQLADAFNGMSVNLGTLVDQLSSSSSRLGATAQSLASVSSSMTDSANQTVSQAASAAETTSMVSSNMASVANALDEMKATVREITDHAAEAASISNQAVDVADQTSRTISRLHHSSDEIDTVINMISSVAEQTNLLALNATIEAARAGEDGKGFAVVANEVKALAAQTADATVQISARIQAIQADIGDAVEANSQVSKTIDRIDQISTTIAAAVEQQSATTHQISLSVDEAAEGSKAIASTTEQVASAARETTRSTADSQQAVAEMGHVAADLDELVSHYH